MPSYGPVPLALACALGLFIAPCRGGGAAQDPYPGLNGFTASARGAQPNSPDPLLQYAWPNTPTEGAQLQVYYAHPATAQVTSGDASAVDIGSGADSLTVRGGPVTVEFDFGVERAAWLEIDATGLDDEFLACCVQLGVSEYSLPEVVNRGPKSPNKTTTPVKHVNSSMPGIATYRLELNQLLYEGVRYGFLMVTAAPSTPFNILKVRLVAQILPSAYHTVGWDSDDTELSRAWWVAAHTLRLNLMPTYFGSILIDRGDRHSWTGDAHLSQRASAVTMTGLRGAIFANLNRTACASCSQNIESYAIYWVLSLCDYHDIYGDDNGVVLLSAFAAAKLDRAVAFFGTNPRLGFMGGDERLGDYFEDISNAESQKAYQMLTIRALRSYSATAGAIPQLKNQAEKYSKSASDLVSRLRSNNSQCWHCGYGMFASAQAINAGFLNQTEQSAIANTFENLDAYGETKLVFFTPFNQFFVVRALFEAGLCETAIKTIRDSWGGQLALGATTFWEVYSNQWLGLRPKNARKTTRQVARNAEKATASWPRVYPIPNQQNGYTSLAHPWAAGVATLLTKYVAGIRTEAPGFGRWAVAPTGGLWAAGSNLHASHASSNIEVQVTVKDPMHVSFRISNAPPGSSGTFTPPAKGPGGGALVSISPSSTKGLSCSAPSVCEFSVTYGKTECPQRRRSSHQSAIREDIVYPAQFLGEDRATGGQWQTGRYGQNGYILFGVGANSSDFGTQALNTTVRAALAQRATWDPTEAGRAAIRMPGGSLAFGALTTGNPNACQQTFYVDVAVKGPTLYQNFSVYLADPGSRNRSQIVSLFDLETKDTVAAWRNITNFEGGVYLTWRYAKGFRVRVSYVRAQSDSDQALLSGIFFN